MLSPAISYEATSIASKNSFAASPHADIKNL